MAKTQPYDAYSDDYDRWFDEHEALYRSELKAVKSLLPGNRNGIEICMENSCVLSDTC